MQMPVTVSCALLPDEQTADVDEDHDKIARQIQRKTMLIFETQTCDLVTVIIESLELDVETLGISVLLYLLQYFCTRCLTLQA